MPRSLSEAEIQDFRVALCRVAERLAGRVIARRRSELGFERNGRLAKVAVDEGDHVKEGAVLAELDTRPVLGATRAQPR